MGGFDVDGFIAVLVVVVFVVFVVHRETRDRMANGF